MRNGSSRTSLKAESEHKNMRLVSSRHVSLDLLLPRVSYADIFAYLKNA